jgi:hypothetical protein
MPIREAEFVIYTEKEVIDELGYYGGFSAICVLNNLILVFTINERHQLFRKTDYRLMIHIKSILSGKEYGYAIFDILEEALKVGKEFVLERFPLVSEQDIKNDSNCS